MTHDPATSLRALPSVEAVLSHPVVIAGVDGVPRRLAAVAVREEIAAWRERALRGEMDAAPSVEDVAHASVRRAHAMRPGLRRVINATGVVLHTNLGRAPLSDAAARAAYDAARHYTNLELDLATGRRGSRHAHAARLLTLLTGAEAAVVVNNNAAAVLLSLRAMAHGREVIVSRGQLVEIGGSFRLPDVMSVSGARLVEVGTTNRTHARDYRGAIRAETAALLFVHQSNFAQSGFVADVSLEEMVAIGREAGLPVLADLGSGCLVDLGAHGLPCEPTIADAVATGAALVMASGDKLLGGPQAGIIAGTRAAVHAVATDPLMRAVRPDKMTLAALLATLSDYCDADGARRTIPALRALTASRDDLRAHAEALAQAIRAGAGTDAEVHVTTRKDVSEAGGGSLPGAHLPTCVVEIRCDACDPGRLAEALRRCDPAVMARVAEDRLLLDPRTLLPGEDALVAAGLSEALAKVTRNRTAPAPAANGDPNRRPTRTDA